MHVLYVLSFIVERVGFAIRPYSGSLIQYLPLLWEESAEHNMLRCAIVSTLVHLVKVCTLFVISGFHHNVDEICAVLGYYAAWHGSSLLMFLDFLMAPSSRVKKSKILEDGTSRSSSDIGQELTTLHCMISQKNTDLMYTLLFASFKPSAHSVCVHVG